jgi:rubrerythrin
MSNDHAQNELALFIAAEGDNFVLPSHSQKIYERYGGGKDLVLVEGDHNSPRPRYVYDSIAIFLQSTLQIPYEWVLHNGLQYVRRLPWTYRQPHHAPEDYTVDELLALSLQDGYGLEDDEIYNAELEMQRDLHDSLYCLLAGTSRANILDNTTPALPGSRMERSTSSITHSPTVSINAGADHADVEQERMRGAEDTAATTKSAATATEIAGKAKQRPSLPVLLSASLSQQSTSRDCSSMDGKENTWTCATCTYLNTNTDDTCKVCGIPDQALHSMNICT